jgi:hypothetical protein
MALIETVDGAYLQDLSGLSSSIKAVIGYAGGPGAYRTWPTADATTVRNSGREWWGVWVPEQGVPLSSADGITAANGMIAALPNFNHPMHCPVFLDIETNQYNLDADGAESAVKSFCNQMSNAGYQRPFGYFPYVVGYDWIARYTNVKPTQLPAGVVGIQYANDVMTGDNWDHSMFDPSLFGPITVPPVQPDPPEEFLEDLMSGVNYVYWFGRTSDGAIWAVNSLTGTYQRMANSHNYSVFKQWLTNAGIPFNGSQVDVAGDMSQFGIEIKDAS